MSKAVSWRGVMGLAFKLAVSVCLFWVVFRFVSFSQVAGVLIMANPAFFPLFVAGAFAGYSVMGYRLFFLLKTLGVTDVSFWKVTRSYFYSSSLGYWLPSAFGMDAAFMWMNRRETQLKRFFLAVILNRALGIAAVAFLGICGLAWLDPVLFRPVARGLAAAGIAGAAVAACLFLFRKKLPFFSDLADLFLKNPAACVWVFLVSFLTYGIQALMIFFFAMSLGVLVSPWLLLLLSVFLQLVMLLPVSFGSLGLQDVSFAAFFSRFGGVSLEQAIGISLLMHFFSVCYALIAALLYALSPRRARS